MADDQLIADLARAVLDGDPVDWAKAQSNSDGADRLIGYLKVVAAVACAHREGSASEPDSSPTSAKTTQLETWGHLRIVERIGRGAFGTVYRAWDTRLDREVALKLIPAADAAASGASSIIREGRLLARVRHPNVATIYGADQIDGYVGLWMEFVHGRTLEELLQDGQTFEPAEATRIGLELARAAVAVHAAGLLHRDIKAQNVMRANDGRIVLMDFGTGRELAEERSDLTGTPLYLAPEVFRGQPATAQTDLYSLGVLLYHLLTGSYPVRGGAIPALRRAHEEGRRVELRAARSDVPLCLERVIARATDPRPEKRPTADMLCRDLENMLRPSRGLGLLGSGTAAALALLVLAWLAWDSSWPNGETPRSVSPPGMHGATAEVPAGEVSPSAGRLGTKPTAVTRDPIVAGLSPLVGQADSAPTAPPNPKSGETRTRGAAGSPFGMFACPSRENCSNVEDAAKAKTASTPPLPSEPANGSIERPFGSDIDVVSVNVTVTDLKGHYVTDVEESEIDVFENNVRQTITLFGRRQGPIALSLLLDSSSGIADRATLLEAATNLVRQLGPDYIVHMVDFDSANRVSQGFTASHADLERGRQESVLAGGSRGLQEAIYIALSSMKAIPSSTLEEPQRKVLIVLSNGQDTFSMESYDEVLDRAKRSDATIHTIGLRDGSNGTRGVLQLAHETGGMVFVPHPRGIIDLRMAFSEIANALSKEYLLKYKTSNPKRAGAWRRTFVGVRRPGVITQATSGY